MLTHSISPMGVFIKTKKKTKEKSIIKLKNKKKIENKLAVQGSEKNKLFHSKSLVFSDKHEWVFLGLAE